MRIPATLVLLGEPITIETESGESWDFRSGSHYLATTGSGTELWIVPAPRRIRESKSIPRLGADMFRRFVGWSADSAFKFAVPDFAATTAGAAKSIAYRSSKWSGRRTGYIHDFENQTKIQVDNLKKPTTWRLTGRKLAVMAEGITG